MGLFGPPNVLKMEEKKDIRGLTKALGYQKDWLVRLDAACALGDLGDVRAVEPLIAALNDKSNLDLVRATIATALGKIGDTRAVEPLCNALQDKAEDVRKAADKALHHLGWQPSQTAVTPDGSVRARLIAALKHEDWKTRQDAIIALGQLGDSLAVEPLIAALADESLAVRKDVVIALGQLADPRAIEPLIVMLADDRLYNEAARALGQIGHPRAVDALIEMLTGHHEGSGRSSAAFALSKIDDDRIMAPLIAALQDLDKHVRGSAAAILGQSGNPGVVEPLIGVLKDADGSVRRDAAIALGRLGDARAVGPLTAAIRGFEREPFLFTSVVEALSQVGAPAVEPLMAALQDDNNTVRQIAAQALGNLGDARAVQTLIALLDDENDRVRASIAKALGKIGDARAVEPLCSALQDKVGNVRQVAAQALEDLGWKPDNGASGAAYWIIRGRWDRCIQIGAPAVDALIEALVDRDENVRRLAAEALGQLGDTRAVEPLLAALQDTERHVRAAAEQALKGFDDAQAVAALKDAHEIVRYRLTETSLGNSLDLQIATERLCVYCTHLRDPNLRDPTYPKGVGECANYGSDKSVVSFDDTCEHWTPNTKVRFWLSKGYMEHNLEGWPRKPWYQVFDDGPDGEKGTR